MIYQLVADGACLKNPGSGGYGCIVVTPQGQVVELGGSEEVTTNNRMELAGFLVGIRWIRREIDGVDVDISRAKIHARLDSTYVLEGAKKNVWSWIKNDWQTQAGSPVKNQDLWNEIVDVINSLKEKGIRIQFEWVKGHSGNEANERVDQISVAFARGEPVELFTGKLTDYLVSLESEPFQPVYLSFLGGQVFRDPTWAECEARVKGKPGARYQKVMNRLQEQQALKKWGAPVR